MATIPITSRLIAASLNEVNPFLEDLTSGLVTDIREALNFSRSNHGDIARRLAEYGEGAVPDLIAAWESCRILDQRICIIDTLGMIASDEATPFLATCLGSASEDERSYAVRALGQIASPDASKFLIEHLPHESHPRMRVELIKTIFKLTDQNPGNDIIKLALSEQNADSRRRAAIALQEDASDEATAMLLNALHDPVWSVANCAARGLKGRSGITEALLDKLPGKGSDIKQLVVRLLGDSKSKEAIPALCKLLHESKNRAVKSDICKALSKINDPECIGSLIDALADPASEVVVQAAQVLGKMKTKAAIGDLENLLTDQERYNFFRQLDIKKASLEALGKINDPAAVQILIKVLDQESTSLKLVAAKGLLRQKKYDSLPRIKAAVQRFDSDDYRIYGQDFEAIVNKMMELAAKEESKKKAAKKS